ncbi:MAG: hypothetical protein ACREV3_03215 [Gammaproteobacteria bacterium]
MFRGKDLFHELKGLSWMGLLLYGITGRFFDEKQIRLFEGIWTICTSYPDPRLWNNRVAAIGSTVRSTASLSIGAANAVSEASIYGHRPIIRAIDFLFRAQEQVESGAELPEIVCSEIKKHKGIFGYGRPIVRNDERIDPLMALANKLGLADGTFIRLAFAVERALSDGRWRLPMNIAAVAAGLSADQGLSRNEYYQYLVLSFSVGMFACYVDTCAKPEGALFPLRCSRIRYEGTPYRRWEHSPQRD